MFDHNYDQGSELINSIRTWKQLHRCLPNISCCHIMPPIICQTILCTRSIIIFCAKNLNFAYHSFKSGVLDALDEVLNCRIATLKLLTCCVAGAPRPGGGAAVDRARCGRGGRGERSGERSGECGGRGGVAAALARGDAAAGLGVTAAARRPRLYLTRRAPHAPRPHHARTPLPPRVASTL